MHCGEHVSGRRYGTRAISAVMTMVRARSLHILAERIYDILDEEGFFDEGDRRMPTAARYRRRRAPPVPVKRKRKAKRKVSAYQKEFGRQLKKLKRAHPRTPVTRLMKRAHAATRRARK